MNQKSNEYYQAAEQSVHVFFLWLMEKVAEEMDKRKLKFRYCSFLTNMLLDLDVIAKALKAKEIDIFREIVPLSGITFTRNDDSPTKGCNDSLFRFDNLSERPCFLGTLTLVSSSPDTGVMQNAISFIMADSEDDGLLAMTNYFQARRELCKARCEVLSFIGEQIVDFEKKQWKDLCLPKKMRDRVRLEVRDFFGAEKHYDNHAIRYRRGLALVGGRGNGKTTACHAIAATSGVPVIYGSAAHLTVEEVPAMLEKTMGYNKPCIVVVEDLDMVVPSEDAETLIRILYVLEKISLTEGVFLVGTINSDSLDANVFRPGLFDTFHFFPNPAKEERNMMFVQVLGNFWSSIDKAERERIIESLEGCSGAVIQEMMSRSILYSKGEPKLSHLNRAMSEVLGATNQQGMTFGF